MVEPHPQRTGRRAFEGDVDRQPVTVDAHRFGRFDLQRAFVRPDAYRERIVVRSFDLGVPAHRLFDRGLRQAVGAFAAFAALASLGIALGASMRLTDVDADHGERHPRAARAVR